MDLDKFSRSDFMIYLGTINAIVKLIDDTSGINIKRLRGLLVKEIANMKKTVMEQ